MFWGVKSPSEIVWGLKSPSEIGWGLKSPSEIVWGLKSPSESVFGCYLAPSFPTGKGQVFQNPEKVDIHMEVILGTHHVVMLLGYSEESAEAHAVFQFEEANHAPFVFLSSCTHLWHRVRPGPSLQE